MVAAAVGGAMLAPFMVLVFASIFLWSFSLKDSERDSLIIWLVLSCFAGGFLGLTMGKGYSVEVDPYRIIVNSQDQIIYQTSKYSERFWKFDSRLKGQILDFNARKITAQLVQHHMTLNPNPITIKYDVVLEVLGSPEGAKPFYDYVYRVPGWSRDTDWIKSTLYEFQYAKSKEMASFYNPYDQDQQRRFAEFIRPAIAEDLKAANARLVSIRFSVE